MLEWDEEKRLLNLEKHGLDFIDSRLPLLMGSFIPLFGHGEKRLEDNMIQEVTNWR